MTTTPKIEELVFPHADFPREFDIQLWAFHRLVWGVGEDRFRTHSWDEPTPTHFVLAAGDLLVSHVLVFPLSIEGHHGTLRVGCVGAVLTFPQFRHEGHASKLMRRAALHIRQTADVGMLFCDPEDASFYERLDWIALPRGRALVNGEIPDGVLMLLGDDLIVPDPIRLPWMFQRPLVETRSARAAVGLERPLKVHSRTLAHRGVLVLDTLTMHPDQRRRVVRLLGELEATS